MKPLEWSTSLSPVPYVKAIKSMEKRVVGIREDGLSEQIWMLEHPPLYTAGTSADPKELIKPNNQIPVFNTGRGGRFTYHGPGQRIVYIMLDLEVRGKDIRKFIYNLEEWVIRSLDTLDVNAQRRNKMIGVWTIGVDGKQAKLASIGIRIKKWVTFHGLSINVNPNLKPFNDIVACGLKGEKTTSLNELETNITLGDIDNALKINFENIFN